MSRLGLALFAALSLGGCTPKAQPLTLFLRQGRPGPAVQFGRVDVNSNDFGSFSTRPPTQDEERSCGSVVAFGAEEGLVHPDGMQVREVLYRLWWYSGSGRGQVGLNAPGLPSAFAPISVVDPAVAGGDARKVHGYSLVDVRLPVDVALSSAQLDSLYLSLDVGGASVKMATCPVRPSMVVLNPGASSDLPGWTDPAAADCLPPTQALVPPQSGDFPSPAWDRELDLGGSVSTVTLGDEGLVHRGDLVVKGSLTLEATRLYLAPGADGRPPRVTVKSGGAFRMSQGALLAGVRPEDGFHLMAEPGSQVEILDSEVAWGGFIRLGDDGRVLPTEVALDLRGNDVVVRGSRLLGNVVALRISGSGAIIRSNVFERNATAIEAHGRGGEVQGNTSKGDGLFVRLDRSSAGWQLLDNSIQHSLDMALWLDGGAEQHIVRGNTITDANAGIAVTDRGDYAVIEDNRVRTCRYPIVRHGLEPDPAILEHNTLEQSDFEGCPAQAM